MFTVSRWISVLICVKLGLAVIPNNNTLEDTFRYCLLSQPTSSLGQCFGVGAMNKLQTLENSQEFELVDGVTLMRDAREFREAYNFAEGDPTNFRGLFDIMGNVFSRRQMHWNMGFLYPGLMLRVGPSAGPGGQLEFVLDAHREALNVQSLKEASTGRLLTRQFLLPLLLGFKFNIASLIPIFFGVIALLAKKALIVSKLALVLVSAFGLGSLVFGYGQHQQHHQHNGDHIYNDGFGHYGYGSHHHHSGYNKFSEEELNNAPYYKTVEESADRIHLHENIQSQVPFVRQEQKRGRNFVWEDDDSKAGSNAT